MLMVFGLSLIHICGTVLENSSNSLLTLGFSNVAVAAVPEPETYAMLLAGLVLVGFSARRQTQA